MEAMADQAATYPRFGYRRINVFMERLGHVMGADKAFRLWSKAETWAKRIPLTAPFSILPPNFVINLSKSHNFQKLCRKLNFCFDEKNF